MTHEIDLRSDGMQRMDQQGERAGATWLVVYEIAESVGINGHEDTATRHRNVIVRTVGRAPTSDEIHKIQESACAYHGALSARVTFFARLGD